MQGRGNYDRGLKLYDYIHDNNNKTSLVIFLKLVISINLRHSFLTTSGSYRLQFEHGNKGQLDVQDSCHAVTDITYQQPVSKCYHLAKTYGHMLHKLLFFT